MTSVLDQYIVRDKEVGEEMHHFQLGHPRMVREPSACARLSVVLPSWRIAPSYTEHPHTHVHVESIELDAKHHVNHSRHHFQAD
jgi:hypothetical protein